MKILGIDPGLATVGYGVIDYIDNNKISLIDCGIISTDANTPFPERLRQIEQGIIELIDSFMPNAVAFEELFFNKNVKTALQVAHARGRPRPARAGSITSVCSTMTCSGSAGRLQRAWA